MLQRGNCKRYRRSVIARTTTVVVRTDDNLLIRFTFMRYDKVCSMYGCLYVCASAFLSGFRIRPTATNVFFTIGIVISSDSFFVSFFNVSGVIKILVNYVVFAITSLHEFPRYPLLAELKLIAIDKIPILNVFI